MTLVALLMVANLLITIYLYPTQRPDYWWLPGLWIFLLLRDRVWTPIKYSIWPETNPKRKFSPPRIA